MSTDLYPAHGPAGLVRNAETTETPTIPEEAKLADSVAERFTFTGNLAERIEAVKNFQPGVAAREKASEKEYFACLRIGWKPSGWQDGQPAYFHE